MIHVGVSKQDHQISVEKCAFNDDYVLQDIRAQCPEDNCCMASAPAQTLHTGLDVDRLCEFSNENLSFLKMKGKPRGL